MKLRARELAQFRDAVEALEPSAFGLIDIDVYPGASPYCARSAVACRFATGHDALLSNAFQRAAHSVISRLGIDIESGVEPGAEETTYWIECFPGGIRRSGILFVLQALRTAIVSLAAEASGEAAGRSRAEREAGRLERAPAPAIFVQSRFLISAARSADVPVQNIGGTDSLWRFGWGSRSNIFFGTASHGDSLAGHQLTWKKPIAKAAFHELGLPTPKWRVLRPGADPLAIAREIGWPCVVKPVDQAFGKGVTANVTSEAELQEALAVARKHSKSMMIEAHQQGFDHRLMVVDGRLVGAVRRNPPAVTGDGQSSVLQLVSRLNQGRDGTRAGGYLLPVEWDAEAEAMLARRNFTRESVIPRGETVPLRSIANFSTGGSAEDVTSMVHPQIRGLAELLATSVGLRTAGIDYITSDISRSHADVGGGFIEVNAMPRLRLLMADGQGEGEISSLVLGDRPGRIPVILLVAGNEAILGLEPAVKQQVGSREGAAAVSPRWAQLGQTMLPNIGLNAFELASGVLGHATVEELVILWSAEQFREFGLPVDRVQRAVVVDSEIDNRWLAPYCSEVVHADGPDEALDVLFT